MNLILSSLVYLLMRVCPQSLLNWTITGEYVVVVC